MGQIVFPTSIPWYKGSVAGTIPVGDYLRLAFLDETYNDMHVIWNETYKFPTTIFNNLPVWDPSNVDWTLIYQTRTSNESYEHVTVVANLLWNATAGAGGGFKMTWEGTTSLVRDEAGNIASDVVQDTDPVLAYYQYPIRSLLVLPPSGYYLSGSIASDSGKWEGYARYCYLITGYYKYESSSYKNGLKPQLRDNVLHNLFVKSGTWISPIIDFGPYIDIISVNYNSVVLPEGGSVSLEYRVSGTAPTTGTPTSFQDTAGNTLYYYGPNETWDSATEWMALGFGSAPTIKDRYMQFRLTLTGA